jgi:hypothetical protein
MDLTACFVRFQVLTAASRKIISFLDNGLVVSPIYTDVSEVATASIIRAINNRLDDGGSTPL